MQSKNLSILLTDIKDYSTRTASSTRDDISKMITTHHALLQPIVDFYRGTVIKTMGDAFLCSFESATDAAVCAVAIQMALQEHNRQQSGEDSTKKLNIRIMISSGDVTIKDSDVFGEAVNLVARMEKLEAFGNGGIGISESTYLLMNRQELVTEELGAFEFKGIGRSVKVYRIPLERQNLDQFPARLSEIRERVKEKTVARRLPYLRWHFALGAAVMAAAIVVVALLQRTGTPFQARQQPTAEEWNAVMMLKGSGIRMGSRVPASEYKGTPEQFKMLDLNHDGILTQDELRQFARSHGFPPPRGREEIGGDEAPNSGK